jgi:hypothetical protein
MKVVITVRQTENGKYFFWEQGTVIQKNFKGVKTKRKVFVFFDKSCNKPISTPVKITVLDGFRGFYKWTSEEGKEITCSTMLIQNYEIIKDPYLKENKELREKATGMDNQSLFTNANGIVPF